MKKKKRNLRNIKPSLKRKDINVSILRFYILLGILILAGIAIAVNNESPIVWGFLSSFGGWAALTTKGISKV